MAIKKGNPRQGRASIGRAVAAMNSDFESALPILEELDFQERAEFFAVEYRVSKGDYGVVLSNVNPTKTEIGLMGRNPKYNQSRIVPILEMRSVEKLYAQANKAIKLSGWSRKARDSHEVNKNPGYAWYPLSWQETFTAMARFHTTGEALEIRKGLEAMRKIYSGGLGRSRIENGSKGSDRSNRWHKRHHM